MADRSKQICLDEKLAETVRNYKILYDKSSKDFKDRQKKALAWDDVAKKVGFRSGLQSCYILYVTKTFNIRIPSSTENELTHVNIL